MEVIRRLLARHWSQAPFQLESQVGSADVRIFQVERALGGEWLPIAPADIRTRYTPYGYAALVRVQGVDYQLQVGDFSVTD